MQPNQKSHIVWQEISSVSKLPALQRQWDWLHARAGESLFTSYDWQSSWITQFWQKHWQLKVLTAFDGDKLVAIVPVYIQSALSIGALSYLYPIGQGEPEHKEVASEYLDVIIEPHYSEQLLLPIKKWLNDINVDIVSWRAALNYSKISKVYLGSSLAQHQSSLNRYRIDCETWSHRQLSRNTRSRWKRSVNQLAKLEAKCKWVAPNDYLRYWHKMEQLHQQRWLNKGKLGAFNSDNFSQFHRRLWLTSSQHHAKMAIIEVDEQPIAIHYYLFDSQTLYFYQSGWDEEQYASLSPGLFLHLWAIENCTLKYYDFMMGSSIHSYKDKFACERTPMFNLYRRKKTFKTTLLGAINKLTSKFKSS